jgi:branched-chain amino acid transport system substrate-binding protein
MWLSGVRRSVRVFLGLLAVGALAAGLAACGSSSSSSSSESSSSESTTASTGSGGSGASTSSGKFDCSSGQITVGIAKALTGTLALFDGNERNGIVLAINELNEEGGIEGCKIKYIQGDTKSDPGIAGQVAKSLIQEGAEVLMVPGDFELGVTAATVAEEEGIVGMSPGASSMEFAPSVGPHFFQGGLNTEDLGNGQADFANSRGWKTSFNVVNGSFGFFKEQEEEFVKSFEGEVVGNDVITPETTNFSGVISKIESTSPEPEVIYGSTFFPGVGTFIRQLRQAGIDTPVLGGPAYSSPELPKVVGTNNIQNVFYVSSLFFEGSKVAPEVAAVAKKYESTFNEPPMAQNAFIGYQGMMAMAEGMKQAGTTEAEPLSEALAAQKNFTSAGMTILGWPNNTAQREVSVIGFDKQGNFVEVEKIAPH